jgi:hypothetical protein
VTRCACKVGELSDDAVQWLEAEMNRNRPYRALCAEVEERYGLKLYPRTLTTHKQQHMGAAIAEKDEWRQTLDNVRDELRREMSTASVLIKPLYMVALRNLDALEDTKPSQDSLIKAVKALSDIQGNASDRDALAAAAIGAAEQAATSTGRVVRLRGEG